MSQKKNATAPGLHTLYRALLLSGCVSLFALPAQAAEYVRISVTEFAKDPKKVEAFKKAVAAMQANNTKPGTSDDFHTSWEYWANTHGYLGDGPKAAGKAATFVPSAVKRNCSGASLTTCTNYYKHLKDSKVPKDGFTDTVWGSCEHGTTGFLPWHRMYLHFFERVLRKKSGDPNFALPYWDYFSETGKGGTGIALPVLVRGTAAGSLYDEWRTPGLNTNTVAIDADSGSAVQAFKATTMTDFGRRLEGQPHGSMHCGTGSGCTAPDIGMVPFAGWDPVFYTHHANIDRLWQCWMVKKAAGQPITLEWAKANLQMPEAWFKTTYTFADENGKKVTMMVEDLFKPGVIESRYDKDKDCVLEMPKPKQALKAAVATASADASASASTDAAASGSAEVAGVAVNPVHTGKATKLKGKSMSLSLTPSKGEALRAAQAPADPNAAPKPANVELTLENVDIEGNPGVSYKLYLGSKAKPKKTAYIATITYFGKLGDSHHTHAREDGSTGKIGTLKYDITDQMLELGAKSAEDLTINFVPTNLTTKAVAEKTTTNGAVTVGNIRVENVTGQ